MKGSKSAASFPVGNGEEPFDTLGKASVGQRCSVAALTTFAQMQARSNAMTGGAAALGAFAKTATAVCALKEVVPRMTRQAKEMSEEEIVVDWTSSVQDLHKVLDVANGLFLTLSAHNEGLVRVALELITAKKSKHIFKWNEDWYADDVRREWFREAVQKELQNVLDARSGTIRTASAEDSVDMTAHRASLLCAEQAEAALEALRAEHRQSLLQLKLAEGAKAEAEKSCEGLGQNKDQIRNLQERLKELNSTLTSTKETCRTLEEQLREEVRKNADGDANTNKMLARMRALETETGALREESKNFREAAEDASKDAAQYLQEVIALRERVAVLEAGRTELEKRDNELTAKMESHKASDSVAEELEALRAWSAQSQQKSSELASQLESTRREMAEMEARCAALQAEAPGLAECRECIEKPCQHCLHRMARVAAASGEKAVQTDVAAQGHREGEEDLDESGDDKLKTLTKENRRLNVVLEELRQKLKELMASCRRKGFDIDDIVEDLGLETVLEGVSIWDRLYGDARNRIARMEKRRRDFYGLDEDDPLPGNKIMEMLESSTLANDISKAQPPIPRERSYQAQMLESSNHSNTARSKPSIPSAERQWIPGGAQRIARGSPQRTHSKAEHWDSDEQRMPPPMMRRSKMKVERVNSYDQMRMSSGFLSKTKMGSSNQFRASSGFTRKNRPASKDRMGSSSTDKDGFARKTGMGSTAPCHSASVASHSVPRRKIKENKSTNKMMGSSLGFSQAISAATFHHPQTKKSMFSSASEQLHRPMNSTKLDMKNMITVPEFAESGGGPHHRVSPSMKAKDRMATSLPSLQMAPPFIQLVECSESSPFISSLSPAH